MAQVFVAELLLKNLTNLGFESLVRRLVVACFANLMPPLYYDTAVES